MEPAANGARPILLAFTVLSILWIVGSGIATTHTQPCGGALAASFWQSYFSCLPPNALGDFLAGTFAPLAFLWLVATVLIQSAELKEQRKELQLTRLEFEQNRKVMEAQVEESRRQAEYIATQTQVMIRQEKAIAEADSDKELTSALKHFRTWVLKTWHAVRPYTNGVPKRQIGYLNVDMPDDPEEFLLAVTDKVQLALDLGGDHWDQLVSDDDYRLELLADKLADISNIVDNCSPSTRRSFDQMDIDGMVRRLRKAFEPAQQSSAN